MKRYSKEFVENIVCRILPPNSERVIDIVKETGISKSTLLSWKAKYVQEKGLSPSSVKSGKGYTAQDKLEVIVKTASLNQAELSEYCRSNGFYPDQIASWKTSVMQSLSSITHSSNSHKSKTSVKAVQELEKELARKEKALAEVAALLVLQKKFQAHMEGLKGA